MEDGAANARNVDHLHLAVRGAAVIDEARDVPASPIDDRVVVEAKKKGRRLPELLAQIEDA
jgi:hypothetical protein